MSAFHYSSDLNLVLISTYSFFRKLPKNLEGKLIFFLKWLLYIVQQYSVQAFEKTLFFGMSTGIIL